MRNGIEVPKHYCLYIDDWNANIRENLIHKAYQNQPLPTEITKIAGHTSNPTCISKLTVSGWLSRKLVRLSHGRS